jgi:hypothetical protein
MRNLEFGHTKDNTINPKLEIRNSKQILNPKFSMFKTSNKLFQNNHKTDILFLFVIFVIQYWNLFRISRFEFRIFGIKSSPF